MSLTGSNERRGLCSLDTGEGEDKRGKEREIREERRER
jgi:hypothetical protein